MSGSFAYHAPDDDAAHPWNTGTDAAIERQPDNMDAQTTDVISNASRLQGARGLPNLKERGT